MSTLPASFAASTTSLDNAMYGASLLHHPGATSHTSYPVIQEASAPSLTAEEVDEGRYVHPTSIKLYQKCGRKLGFLRYFPIFGEAVECYGPKFMFTLDFTQFVSKGIAYTIIGCAFYPIFMKYFHTSTLEYNRFSTVATMGWSIKPFTALISDSFAIFRYKKRWLLTISALFLGALCSFILAFLPHRSSSAVAGALLAFLVGLGQANIDILSEGMYARKIREHPSAGPNMVSTVWIVQMIASIIAAVTQGPLSDEGFAWVGMVICGACMAICVPVLLLNWFEEKPNRLERIQDATLRREQREEERRKKEIDEKGSINDPFEVDTKSNGGETYGHADQSTIAEEEAENINSEEELVVLTYCGGVLEFNKEVIVQNWRITVLCFVMATVVVATAIITALYEGWVLLGVTAGGAILFSVLFFWALPLTVSKAGFYCFSAQCLYLGFGSALSGFYLVNPACPTANYPQFSYTFANSITGVIGGIAGLAGVIAFNYIFSKSTYRLTFCVTSAVYVLGSVFDLIMVERWNLPAIPDKYFYVFGDAIISEVAYMLNWMPLCILLGQLCPRGSEAMVYALLAAFAIMVRRLLVRSAHYSWSLYGLYMLSLVTLRTCGS